MCGSSNVRCDPGRRRRHSDADSVAIAPARRVPIRRDSTHAATSPHRARGARSVPPQIARARRVGDVGLGDRCPVRPRATYRYRQRWPDQPDRWSVALWSHRCIRCVRECRCARCNQIRCCEAFSRDACYARRTAPRGKRVRPRSPQRASRGHRLAVTRWLRLAAGAARRPVVRRTMDTVVGGLRQWRRR